MNSISDIDDIIISVKEKIEGKGEDSFCFDNISRPGATLMGVFDGCGGAGAQKHVIKREDGNVIQHTGAYLASRIVSGTVTDWFRDYMDLENKKEWPKVLKGYINLALEKYVATGLKVGIKSRLAKVLPTTIAGVVLIKEQTGVSANCLWAGDSRIYILDEKGAHQISIDDAQDDGTLKSAKNDGPMNNIISASVEYDIHMKEVSISKEAMVICTTDGGYGYLKSPIHFEYFLLKSLMESDSILEWRKKLKSYLGDVAGDDFAVVIALYKFKTFENVKRVFVDRIKYMENAYISCWDDLTDEEQEIRWSKYKEEVKLYE